MCKALFPVKDTLGTAERREERHLPGKEMSPKILKSLDTNILLNSPY